MQDHEFQQLLQIDTETEHIEFKEARTQFNFEAGKKSVCGYCVALANERGGRLILGVSDKLPRKAVGTSAFPNLIKLKSDIFRKIGRRIEAKEIIYNKKRIVIISIHSRPIGEALHFDGQYLMRIGEDLESMTSEQIRRISLETESDFSATICDGLIMDDLDQRAIDRLREEWHRKTKNNAILQMNDRQLLTDLDLQTKDGINYSALLLLGTKAALTQKLPCAELSFEYRKNDASIPSQERIDFREGFLLYFDQLWEKINARNESFHFQEGFFMRDIPAFNQEVVRESILNAVTHRDYRIDASVFVRQSFERIIFENPGGFLQGINPNNIYTVPSKTRNRRLAEVLQKIGLVERSGQGVDKIFRFSIEEGKGLPDYTQSTQEWVKLSLNASVQDQEFLRYLEEIINKQSITLSLKELITLENIKSQSAKGLTKNDIRRFLDAGIVEQVGKTRGARYILSRKYYSAVGKAGTHTRIVGTNREQKKMLILNHLKNNSQAKTRDFLQIFTDLKSSDVRNLLQELKRANEIVVVGRGQGAIWKLNQS